MNLFFCLFTCCQEISCNRSGERKLLIEEKLGDSSTININVVGVGKKKEGEMIEFKPNKKDIMKVFDEKKTALEDVFKDSAYKKGLTDAQLAQIVKIIDK